LFHHPIRGGEESGRVGHARAINVGEVEKMFHHLGILERLRFDTIDGVQIDAFFSEGGDESASGGEEEKDGAAPAPF
jgi:hypothetical protein